MNMIIVVAAVVAVVVLIFLAWFFYPILRTDWMDEWVQDVISKNQEITEKDQDKK